MSKTLREIDYDLPNGFHDAFLETLTLNLVSNSAELRLELWVGGPDGTTEEEREASKSAKLYLTDLVYFVIDPPGPGYKPPLGGDLWIDAGDATDRSDPRFPKPLCDLPADAFAYWFFIRDWNSYIHVAAKGASLEWL